jgi:hypothetical protein
MSMGEVMPIQAGQADYSQEVNDFNGACKQGSGCDFVAYLLEPQTALQWVQDGGMSLPMPHGYPTGLQGGGAGYAGPQPLFTNSFAVQCGSTCNGFTVWTGFSPDSAPFAGQPPVQQYAADVQSYRGDADLNNQFLEGGYVGMKLLVQALQQTGPYLTRARLKQTLDSSTLDLGLSSPLSFKQGYHYADVWSQGFAINYTQGFTGFQYLQTGWVQDPWVGMDESSG